MKEKRKTILTQLLELRLPITILREKLSRLPWDSKPLVILTKTHISSILNKYLTAQINAKIIEDWANLIENRDDIDYEKGFEQKILDIISELANPILYTPFTPKRAQEIITTLKER